MTTFRTGRGRGGAERIAPKPPAIPLSVILMPVSDKGPRPGIPDLATRGTRPPFPGQEKGSVLVPALGALAMTAALLAGGGELAAPGRESLPATSSPGSSPPTAVESRALVPPEPVAPGRSRRADSSPRFRRFRRVAAGTAGAPGATLFAPGTHVRSPLPSTVFPVPSPRPPRRPGRCTAGAWPGCPGSSAVFPSEIVTPSMPQTASASWARRGGRGAAAAARRGEAPKIPRAPADLD